jgi:hypothetical protein
MGKAEKTHPKDETTEPLTELISVELSDREVAELGRKLARTRIEQITLDKEYAEVKADFSARLRALSCEIDLLAKQVNDRTTEIEIPVELVFDDARSTVAIVRAGDGEVLRTRDMTVQEKGAAFTRRQTTLPGLLESTDLVDAKDHQDETDRQDAAVAAARPFLGDDGYEPAPSPFDDNHLGLPGRGDENSPDDEEPEPAPDEDDGPVPASSEEEPPESAQDFIEHKGQHLRRVSRKRSPGPEAT